MERIFQNGWAASIVQSEFSMGTEIALLKVRPRKSTLLERLRDLLTKKKEMRYEGKLVFDNLLNHPTFQNGVYAYLKPKERREILKRCEALKTWKEW